MNVTISIIEYEVLIRKAEMVEAVERLLNRTKYVSVDDIKAILDIKETVGSTDGEL